MWGGRSHKLDSLQRGGALSQVLGWAEHLHDEVVRGGTQSQRHVHVLGGQSLSDSDRWWELSAVYQFWCRWVKGPATGLSSCRLLDRQGPVVLPFCWEEAHSFPWRQL